MPYDNFVLTLARDVAMGEGCAVRAARGRRPRVCCARAALTVHESRDGQRRQCAPHVRKHRERLVAREMAVVLFDDLRQGLSAELRSGALLPRSAPLTRPLFIALRVVAGLGAGCDATARPGDRAARSFEAELVRFARAASSRASVATRGSRRRNCSSILRRRRACARVVRSTRKRRRGDLWH